MKSIDTIKNKRELDLQYSALKTSLRRLASRRAMSIVHYRVMAASCVSILSLVTTFSIRREGNTLSTTSAK